MTKHVKLPDRPANPRMEFEPVLEVEKPWSNALTCQACSRPAAVTLVAGQEQKYGEVKWRHTTGTKLCGHCLMTLVGKVDLWLMQEGLVRQVANEAGRPWPGNAREAADLDPNVGGC